MSVSSLITISSQEMAEFLPNLDDGELWLPSDIFLNDAAASRYRMALALTPRRFSPAGQQLSRSCSALTSLPPRPSDDYPLPVLTLSQKQFQWIARPAQHSTMIRPPAMTSSGAVHHGCGHRNALFPAASKLLYDDYRLLRAAQMPQVEVQSRVLPPHRQLPNQLGVSNRGIPASRRERGGTGVFLPRVAEYAAATDSRRKRGPRSTLDIQISQQMNSLKRVGAAAKPEKECHRELPLELVLPHDWTY